MPGVLSLRSKANGGAQPKTPIEVRLAKLGLSEAEIQRRKRISEAAKGRAAWNKGKKHSAGEEARTAALLRMPCEFSMWIYSLHASQLQPASRGLHFLLVCFSPEHGDMHLPIHVLEPFHSTAAAFSGYLHKMGKWVGRCS